jgi:gpW
MMATASELVMWRQQLAEAEAALHSILVQGSIARMRHGDKSMEWNAQNVGDLRAYIAELKGKLGQNGRGSARRVIF